jgi:hypothetical protein
MKTPVIHPSAFIAPNATVLGDVTVGENSSLFFGAVVRSEDRRRLDMLTRGGHHQGVAIKTSSYPYVDFEDILADVRDDENALVVVLDHIEDPQNVGSVLRTACAVGATGVLIPEDRGCGVTPSAVRASSGASELFGSALLAVGVAYLFSFAAELARALGEGTVASALELLGRVEIVVMAAPALAEILKMAEEIIKGG